MIPTLSLIGRSNSGKTTLIEKLVLHFKEQGYHVAVIKHTHHDFSFDKKGKDSYRHREAGADAVIITNDHKIGMTADLPEALTPLEAGKTFLPSHINLLIIEGFKDLEIPKLEIIGDSEEPPLFLSGLKGVRALISDKVIDSDLPLYKRNDIKGISEFIEKKFLTS